MLIKKYPYISCSVFAIILAVVVWSVVPKKYSARVKLSDEYKEVDLAVGLDRIQTYVRDMSGGNNVGVNDIEVYAKLLIADNFAKELSQKKVYGTNKTYGEYLSVDDTIKQIKKNINYNLSTKQGTLIIEFSDKSPVVAAQMLDSVVTQLQYDINKFRRELAEKMREDAYKKLKSAKANYSIAQRNYSLYADSHFDAISETEKATLDDLEGKRDQAFKSYQDVAEKYYRQTFLLKREYKSFAIVRGITVPQENNSHLIGYVLAFLIISLSALKLYRMFRNRLSDDDWNLEFGNLFSPWTITLLVWGMMFFFITFSTGIIEPVGDEFYKSISIWIIVFVISSFVTYNIMPSVEHRSGESIDVNKNFFNFFYLLAVLLTPLYVYQIYKIISMFDMSDLMSNVRTLAINSEGYGFLNYTLVVNQALLLVALWHYPKMSAWQLATIIICCITCALANMEKITFFMLFVTIIYVLYEKRIVKIRSIVIFSVIILLAFYFFNIYRAGEDESDKSDFTMIDFLGMYLLSPPVAFGHLRTLISSDFCSDSLWGLYLYFGKWFNGAFEAHQQFQEFVFVPMPTNVYTVIRPFYQDLGNMGVGFFAYVYGIFSGYVYRKAKNGVAFHICLYTYVVFALSLQFFDELIFATLPMFFQRMILLYLICQNKLRLILSKRQVNLQK